MLYLDASISLYNTRSKDYGDLTLFPKILEVYGSTESDTTLVSCCIGHYSREPWKAGRPKLYHYLRAFGV